MCYIIVLWWAKLSVAAYLAEYGLFISSYLDVRPLSTKFKVLKTVLNIFRDRR